MSVIIRNTMCCKENILCCLSHINDAQVVGGGGGHSNLGYPSMFLKILLLKNYRSEGGKSIFFWKALCIDFSKMPK